MIVHVFLIFKICGAFPFYHTTDLTHLSTSPLISISRSNLRRSFSVSFFQVEFFHTDSSPPTPFLWARFDSNASTSRALQSSTFVTAYYTFINYKRFFELKIIDYYGHMSGTYTLHDGIIICSNAIRKR